MTFFGQTRLKNLQIITKRRIDVIVISYQYYPVYSAATVTLKSSGIPLTTANAIMLNYNTTDYYGNNFQQFFVGRTGISDNLIDMEITSDSYTWTKDNSTCFTRVLQWAECLQVELMNNLRK